MAIAQASAYGLHAGWASAVPSHQHPIKLLCGAITDSAHDGWRDAAADNGLFEVCDGLSLFFRRLHHVLVSFTIHLAG